MSHNDMAFDSTVSGNNRSDTGMLHVPAQVQRDLGIALDDTVEVTLEDLDHEFIESISFENRQVAGDSVSVPASIMRQVGLEAGDQVTASFALPDEDATDEAVEEALDEMEEAVEEAEEEEDTSLGELFSDDEEEEEEEEEGLGELFG